MTKDLPYIVTSNDLPLTALAGRTVYHTPSATFQTWTGTTWANLGGPKISHSVYVEPHIHDIKVESGNLSYETVTREELVKYISDRKLREENEVVRKLWDRYQVAAKLVGSNDDGDHGS